LPFRRCLISLLLLVATTGFASTPTDARASMGPGHGVLLVLGDSLSAGYGIRVEEGWVTLLGQRLDQQGYGYRVVNASVSGETTTGGLARLSHLLETQQPSIVILELGANDGLRGLPIREIRQNLSALAQRAKSAGARVLLVGIRIPDNYGPRYNAEFTEIFPTVARAVGCPLVPSLIDGIALDDRNFQSDRLHPTAGVQGTLLDNVWRGLRPLLSRAPTGPGR
jgi:acyl-CoA thioesterase I